MKSKIFVLSIFISFLGSVTLQCMGGTPLLYPSTLAMEVGERVYLRGENLSPEEIVTFTTSESSTVFSVRADLSGNLDHDITRYPGPTSTQSYVLSYAASSLQSGAHTNFTVAYAPSIVEPWSSKIETLFLYEDVNQIAVYLWSTISIGRPYRAEWAANLNGPWSNVGSLKKLWTPENGTNVFFDFSIPKTNMAFFRITSFE